jgi:lysophospholipase L1-like esterase
MKQLSKNARWGWMLAIMGIGVTAWADTTNTAIIPTPRDAKWMARHEGFLAEAKQIDPDIVFLGDSITDGWRTTGKSIWEERITPLNAANFGIDGDRTQHVLWRIDHGEFDKVKPKVIVLMIGTNNTPKGRNSVPETIEGVSEVVHRLRTKLPRTKILLLGIFPRGQKGEPVRDQLKEINQAISKLDDGKSVKYLDIGNKFLQEDGTLPTDIMPDLLHPNQKGYEIWAGAIEGTLKGMLKE